MLTREQVDFYEEFGYLRIPQVFNRQQIDAMDRELEELIQNWAVSETGWSGPWRKVYMDAATEKKSKLIGMHELQQYSQAWADAVINPVLTEAMADLLGPSVEFHHTTLHAKPPESGHPFPLHQDNAFYPHTDGRFVDVLAHLDDTDDNNGCIRFLAGSHKLGYLEHVTCGADGVPCSPHLPTDKYHLDDTVPVPAKRGDVVVFHIHTIHGSRINQTDRIRRLVRMGYRHPENVQTNTQAQGWMVRGMRQKVSMRKLALVEE